MNGELNINFMNKKQNILNEEAAWEAPSLSCMY